MITDIPWQKNMQYITAWLVRTFNRILILVVALVTVMWMLFLLDMNAATLKQQQIHYKRQQELKQLKLKPIPTEDPDDQYFKRLESDMRQPPVREEPDYRPPEPANPEPPQEPEVRVIHEPEVQPDIEKPEVIHEPLPAESAGAKQNGGQPLPVAASAKKTSDRDNNAKPAAKQQPAKKAAAAKSPNHKADTAVARATGSTVDASVLTQFKLADMHKAPPLPISQEAISSCFCVENGQGTTKISADDAALFGCPKQDNLELRCLPKFFLAGCNNCGTSDLLYRLNKHQLVNFGAKKEPDFWLGKFPMKFGGATDNLDQYTTLQYGEAAKLILDALRGGKEKKAQPIIGETSQTLYSSLIGKWGTGGPPVSTPLKHLLPDAKFIFLLRDPVERSIAQYNALPGGAKSAEDFDSTVDTFFKWFKLCTTKRNLTEHQCMFGPPDGTAKIRPTKALVHDIINSIYFIPMKEWVKKFGKDQILVLKFEEYLDNRLDAIQQKIIPFLDIKDYTNGPLTLLRNSESDKTMKLETEIKIQMSDATRTKLKAFFAPYNKRLANLLGMPSLGWS